MIIIVLIVGLVGILFVLGILFIVSLFIVGGVVVWFVYVEWCDFCLISRVYDMVMLVVYDGFWEWDLVIKVLYVGICLLEIFGYDEDFLVDIDGWLMLVYFDDCVVYNRVVVEYFKGKMVFFYSEYWVLVKDGIYCWIVLCGLVVCDWYGKVY